MKTISGSSSEKKCRVIHFPIDAAPYAAASPSWDEGLPPAWLDDPLILFVGRLVYYKGLSVLLNALSLVPELFVVIVGVGPLRADLVAQVERLGLTARVTFLDSVAPSTLLGLYKTSSFFVLPSIARSEAFGMVQLESMAASRAVISTDLPSGVPYVNQHGKTGLVVPPNDAAALARAMQRLAEDPQFSARLGNNGRRRASEDFDIDHVVEQHVALYREISRDARASTSGDDRS